jgi:peptidoglycan/LPS O-acetylase OafA/YrhL
MEYSNPGLLKTKPHFEVLDGLRGIAALAVVIFHFMEWVYTDYSKNFIGHGFLAVDFFFLFIRLCNWVCL